MNTLIKSTLLLLTLACTSHAGDLTGRVTLKGTPPPEKAVKIMDPAIAAAYPAGLTTRRYQVSPDGGLQSVLVFVRSDFKGQTFTPPVAPALLDHSAGLFQPYVLAVQAGQPVQFKCSDHDLCTFVALAKANPPFALPPVDTALTRPFNKPEMAIPFKCDMHPWNRAYVSVFAHPYFAVTDANGRYTIRGLPAGNYTMEIHHPTAGSVSKAITMEEKGATADFEVKPK